MNDYVATRSDVKLTFPLVSINENYCSWNRSSITTVPYSLLLSTSLIKLRKLSENFTVPRCAHVPPIFLPENPRLLVSDSFFDRFQTKTEIPTAIVCTRHDNSFHRFTINLERHPPPWKFHEYVYYFADRIPAPDCTILSRLVYVPRARTPKWRVNLQWY